MPHILHYDDDAYTENEQMEYANPENLFMNEELKKILATALSKLKDGDQKEAFNLYYLGKPTYAEIAVKMDKTIPAVTGLINKAWMKQQQLLTAYFKEYNKR